MTDDLLVVGGGPVGLAVALEARMAGLDVTVLDRRHGDIDKACGEGIMPAAVASLARWGVHPQGATIAGFRYSDGRRAVEHRFRGEPGLGARRLVLHRAMSERADALGVRRVAATVHRVQQDAGGVRAAGTGARWLIAADGLHSTVRAQLHPVRRPARHRRFGLRQHFAVAPWTDVVEVHWLPGAELYVTPVGDHAVGIAVLGGTGLDLGTAIAAVPALARRLSGAEPLDSVRGAGPLRQHVSRRVDGRIALVGDAGGYVDALTGEGLRLGFLGAELAVAAILRGDLGRYETAMRRATAVPDGITASLLRLAASPARGAIVPAAAALPRLFGAVVERLAA